METNLNANHIKTLIIDEILEKYNGVELIASEVPYLYGKRKADILLIQNSLLVGFEIKSKYDQLSKLLSQTTDYLNVFNLYYIVLSDKFKNTKLLEKIPKNVGIIYVDSNGKIINKRKAIIKKNIDKKYSSLFMWKSDIKEYLKNIDNKSIKEVRENFIKTYNNKQVLEYSISALKKRYERGYYLFLREKGSYTNIEDLKNLTKINKKNYLY